MDSIKLITQNTNILQLCNNLTWTSSVDTLGTQMTFDSLYDIAEGAVVSLFFNDVEYFRGIVIIKTVKRWTISYTVQDYSFYFKNSVVKQFNGVTASEAIKQLVSSTYTVFDIVDIPTVITHIYVDEIGNIMDDILEQAEQDQGIKYIKEINANVLTVKELSDMVITPKIIFPADIDIQSSMEEMKNKIIITSGDETSTKIVATAEDTTQQDWYGVLSYAESVDETDIAKAQNIANNLLKEMNKITNTTTFNVTAIKDGHTIKANRMISLECGQRLSGFYRIKSATHTLANGIHSVSIELEW